VDVNGTRFHLLLGARDWVPRLAETTVDPAERAAWDPRSEHVTLRQELFRFPPRATEARFSPADRRGAARDVYGHFYWISSDQRSVRCRAPEQTASTTFWSVDRWFGDSETPRADRGAFAACPPPQPAERPMLSGLAVTTRHFLVVGTLAPAGLLLFDLHGGGPPVWIRWPLSVPFAPYDLAATPEGGLWILDRPAAGSGARLWRLDRDFRVARAGGEVESGVSATYAFRPLDPTSAAECVTPSRTFPSGIALDLASPPLPASGDVVALAALPDGTALVMETDVASGDTLLHRWTLTAWNEGSPGTPGAASMARPASLALALSDLLGEATTIVGHDMAFVAEPEPGAGLVMGRLYVADTAGNQSFAFTLLTGVRGTAESSRLEPIASPAYFPLRRWAGKALIACGGEAYYDLADGWLPLTELTHPRYALRGTLDRIVLDGKDPGCVWHRLMLDACIPPGDGVDVESRAADDETDLYSVPWRREPALRLRPEGPELAWTQMLSAAPSAPGSGTWELLFQAATGRYLELRLTLRGSGRSSPKLRALRAHYPRFSYLRYLPAAYREDSGSASFLDRFLANFEGLLTELEGRIAAAEVLFDHATAPSEALGWLAEWLGAALDGAWDEGRRRRFLAHAPELYRRRGTRRGLLAAVRLALEECPSGDPFSDEDDTRRPFGFRLSEGFRDRDASDHRFTVLLPVELSSSPQERARLRAATSAVVERERPAHTAFDVQLYWALFRVGAARVGHDTALGEGSRFSAVLLDVSYLGQSVLAERHPWNVRDRRVVGRDREGYPPSLA
jgi:phage tail-like protein